MNTNIKKILQIGALFLFFILITAYALFSSKDLLFGIKIKNVNIIRDKDNVFKISGTARNARQLVLNNREILIDMRGNFGEVIALLPGYNIITISARDKFNKIDEKKYRLFIK